MIFKNVSIKNMVANRAVQYDNIYRLDEIKSIVSFVIIFCVKPHESHKSIIKHHKVFVHYI